MPIITGSLTPAGCFLDVTVGVSRRAARTLEKRGLAPPVPVHVRALIDTGSMVTGFSPRVFAALGLLPIATMGVVTPSTTHENPHLFDVFRVSLSLVANGSPRLMGDVQAIQADCWHADENAEALIGLDILNRCFFQCHGTEGWFTVSF